MQIECKKSLKSKKKIFFNAADILDAGSDEKQVFFFGVALDSEHQRSSEAWHRIELCILLYVYVCRRQTFANALIFVRLKLIRKYLLDNIENYKYQIWII